MFQRGKSAAQQPSLFDIRNTVLIKGTEYEAPSVLLTGHLVFSLPEATRVKAVGLELTGTFKLDFMESVTDHRKVIANIPVKAEATVFRCSWDNLLVQEKGSIKTGDYGHPVVISDNALVRHVTSALNELLVSQESPGYSPSQTGHQPGNHSPGQRLSSPKPRLRRSNAPTLLQLPPSVMSGSTPFEGVSTPTGGVSFNLPADNYSLPFSCVLPGNVPETVEGLQSGSLLYKLDAVIDKGKHQFKRSKYIRIFRTPSPSDALLSDDCSIENTWSGKVQYQVRLPRKALPIGGTAKIEILIIPLSKGLKLGKITCCVQQQCELKGANGRVYNYDSTIYESDFPSIPAESLSEDRWALEGLIQLPPNLKQCTQDCRLKNDIIIVKHRLLVTVKIINPDGHFSEVRSKLPVVLYVTSKVPVEARSVAADNDGVIHFRPGFQPLFEPVGSGSHSGHGDISTTVSPASPTPAQIHTVRDEDAGETPEGSMGIYENDDDPVLPAYDASSRDPLFSPSAEDSSGHVSPFFGSASNNASGFSSPAMQYLSRVNSASNLAGGQGSGSGSGSLFPLMMSVLPSYDSAADEDVTNIDLAPPYQDTSKVSETESSSSGDSYANFPQNTSILPGASSQSQSRSRPFLLGRHSNSSLKNLGSNKPLLSRAFSSGSLSGSRPSTPSMSIAERLTKRS
ncbi:unnamed protein product [Kuraishia capsulata CBS 1993]|uniref:Arrestin C-terminal-like domain-containing protein n=1 Tax=Kuraishia capsulata CBS 1993 TaxID=1382522 RepID=W6MWM8_9ASCO|nr:uncharacterized protein KUCA_T00003649001 [Kuraishia capsulata CBS 1993]CDK27670.1 unnamed protein product [Kuraishia capsulata CBS 1993]